MMINETSRSQLEISPSMSNLGDADETYFKIPGVINNFSSINNHQSRASILTTNNAKTSLIMQPIRETNIQDKHTLRNRDHEILDSSDDEYNGPHDRMGGQSIDDNSTSMYNEVKFAVERSPYVSRSPERRLLTNVRSASSLHMELHMNNLRNMAGIQANTSKQINPTVQHAHRLKSNMEVHKVRTKGKFDRHVEIDDMKIRDRD